MAFLDPSTPTDVLQNIEFLLKTLYDERPDLQDFQTILAMKKARVAIKQHFGFGQGQSAKAENELEQRIIDLMLEIGLERIGKINNLPLATFEKCLDKVTKSIERHRSGGPRGYYEFIRQYVG